MAAPTMASRRTGSRRQARRSEIPSDNWSGEGDSVEFTLQCEDLGGEWGAWCEITGVTQLGAYSEAGSTYPQVNATAEATDRGYCGRP